MKSTHGSCFDCFIPNLLCGVQRKYDKTLVIVQILLDLSVKVKVEPGLWCTLQDNVAVNYVKWMLFSSSFPMLLSLLRLSSVIINLIFIYCIYYNRDNVCVLNSYLISSHRSNPLPSFTRMLWFGYREFEQILQHYVALVGCWEVTESSHMQMIISKWAIWTKC